MGYVTIKEAITRSINLVAVKVEDQIGLKTGAEYGEKFGLTLSENDKSSIAALSLGQIEGATTLQMSVTMVPLETMVFTLLQYYILK